MPTPTCILAARLLSALVIALSLSACDQKIATVGYSQIGACDAGMHKAWVFFQIGQIDNTSPPQDFNFNPLRVRLFAGMDPQTPWPGYFSYATEFLTSSSQAIPGKISVPHGTSKSVMRYMVFQRWTGDPDGSKEANQTAYFLEYEKGPPDPPVFMAKTNSAQTEWRDTSKCNEIVLPNQNCQQCHQGVPMIADVRKMNPMLNSNALPERSQLSQ